jgi:Sulfatase-modifying factor enzyme 1
MLSVAEVRQHLPRTVGDLARLANPRISNELLNYVWKDHKLVVLLDGLDEVVDPLDKTLSQHQPLLRALGQVIPANARLVITCRSVFYSAIAADVPLASAGQSVDSTDAAIAFALGEQVTKPEVLTLCDVSIDESEKFLSRGPAGNIWPVARERFNLTEFVKSPFTLKLLERALPALLSKAELLDLDRLYEVAITAMLKRDGRIGDEYIDTAMEALENLVMQGTTKNQNAEVAGISCGILIQKSATHTQFQHRSLAEFFFSRALFRELAKYDSTTLARMDLIRGFNICRFLVPRIKRNYQLRAEGNQVGIARWVTSREFVEFCRRTGWRLNRWGWTPYEAEVAKVEYASEASLEIEHDSIDLTKPNDTPATGISWFDAVQYCRWAGRKLLSSDLIALMKFGCSELQPRYSWALDWNDEKKGYVEGLVVEVNGDVTRAIGINPDYRSRSLGIGVL